METELKLLRAFTWKLLYSMHAFFFLFSTFQKMITLARHLIGGTVPANKGKQRVLFPFGHHRGHH
jgi:hypothetical protein